MSNDLLFQARQNRLLAGIRVLQASFAVVAALLEANQPGPRDDVGRYVLIAYLVFSVTVLAATRVVKGALEKQFIIPFVCDFIVFTAILYLTYGAISPFFLLFVFIVLSATLQWGWRGAAGTTVLMLLVFVPIGLAIYPRTTGSGVDLTRFIMRVGNMLALGGLLIAFGRHRERVERDMRQLFGPPLHPAASERPPVEACLERAVSVFRLKRGVFVWGDPEEPRLTISELSENQFVEREWSVAAGADYPVFDPIEEPFIFDRSTATALRSGADAKMAPLAPAILQNPILQVLAGDRALVLPVKASSFAGWMILSDPPYLALESLLLGGAVAAQLSVAIQAWRSLMVWREAAASEARLKLSRDLHDGILQFLAGTAMQLEALARDITPAQRDSILRLQQDLKQEQRQLRDLVTGLGPPAQTRCIAPVDLRTEMQQLMTTLQRQWNAECVFEADTANRRLPGRLAFELLQIVREAISNAVRHGRASAIRVQAAHRERDLVLMIVDNGVGMPLAGTFNMDDLDRLDLGPRSLRARIAQLGGTLSVSSSLGGSALHVTLPIEEAAA